MSSPCCDILKIVADESYTKRTRIEAPAAEVFRWHERPGALDRLTPPWENVRVIQRPESLRDGARAILEMKIGPLRKRWVAEHFDYQAGRQFCDRQLSGPFAAWTHRHLVEPDGDDACHLIDEITYRLPGGGLGRAVGGKLTRRKIERMFAYRHAITREDIMAHQNAPKETMRILMAGSSGLVGSALVPFLEGGGHEVIRLVRGEQSEGRDDDQTRQWNPDEKKLDPAVFEGVDAVVHLGGVSIAEGRWNEQKKKAIRESRVRSTALLAETMAAMDAPPETFLCASAIGYYGDRGDERLTEESAIGRGFLPVVCGAWEGACEPARRKGIRVVNTRLGMILSPKGGALEKMLLPFKLGGGGVVGSGRQYWSWIALDDVVRSMHFLLNENSLDGAVNLTAPNPVTNREFTKVFGKVLGRPTILPVPKFAARIALGEMADALLLASARVEPARLRDAGYEFRFRDLESALRHLLGR